MYFVFFVVAPAFDIRVHSCPFVVHTLPPAFFFVPFVFFVVPFVVHTLPPSLLFSCLSCFSWFHSCISWFHSCPFVSIRGSYSLPCFLFRVFRVFRGSTPVFRGSIRGSERWRRGLSSLPAAGFASSLSGYINRVWTETGGRSDYFGEESPDTTGQEARLKDRVSRGKPAVRIAQQRRDRRHFVSARVKKAG